MTCAVIGDSIAVGLQAQMPACAVVARKGISAPGWVTTYRHPVTAELIVISLGSNPASGTARALHTVRQRAHARRVVWVVPVHANAQAVLREARLHGDKTVWFRPAADGVHPHSYVTLMLQLGWAL